MQKLPSEQIKNELANARDRYNEAVQQTQQLASKQISIDLDSDLGQLILTAYGQLVDVRLNTDQLAFANGRSLATAVMRALERGEEEARRLREPKEPKGYLR
ncbi:hypothetical protein GCM10011581_19440 [Saccharopolyspora subtropica]|uniref:Uncharacterized protein n=1 Tax=Saccharopolyspora thermophila TaxID=89367 RepID=A0A917NA55_9PSEU|nr:hypothetical protein [Saccharopolyspora subtropica]GGI82114.1 hypothetical protein GCM10011581_19440 [Saccharopolyspora subtropica]